MNALFAPGAKRNRLLIALALALACLVRAQAQPTRALPQLAFAYPAGGQQGATFTVAVGGQHLAGTSAAIFSTPAITARVTAHERPLLQKEINELREKLQVLQDKRAAHRGDPTKPTFTAEDELTSAAIRQGRRQGRPVVPSSGSVPPEAWRCAHCVGGHLRVALEGSAA